MKLYIVRHGETRENIKGIIQGQVDTRLSRTGLKQAKLLARRLSVINFDHIYSSDLERAMRTAREIAKYQTCPLTPAAKLRERNFGEFSGRHKKHIIDFFRENELEDVYYKKIAGIEPLSAMRKRVIGFIDKIYSRHKDQTILISAHGGVKRVLLLHFNHLPIEKFSKYPRFENTGLSIVQFHENGLHRVILENDIKHLDMPVKDKSNDKHNENSFDS